MFNNRAWNEWSDAPPEDHMGGHVEAEYIDMHGELDYAIVRQYHYSDERGSLWGFSTGHYWTGDYKTHHPKFYRWRFVGPTIPLAAVQGKAIIVWEFYDAPGELRAMSNHGGDEDWIALLPQDSEQPGWMQEGSSFGCCSVSKHELPDGRRVYIGAHA